MLKKILFLSTSALAFLSFQKPSTLHASKSKDEFKFGSVRQGLKRGRYVESTGPRKALRLSGEFLGEEIGGANAAAASRFLVKHSNSITEEETDQVGQANTSPDHASNEGDDALSELLKGLTLAGKANTVMKNLFAQIEENLTNKNFAAARENYQQVIQELKTQDNSLSNSGKQAKCLALIAQTYFNEGNTGETINYLQQAIEHRDSQGNYGLVGKYRTITLQRLSALYLKEKQPLMAIESLKGILELPTLHPILRLRTYGQLGHLYTSTGQNANTIRSFDEALKMSDPQGQLLLRGKGRAYANFYIGQAFVRDKMYRETIPHLEEALSLTDEKGTSFLDPKSRLAALMDLGNAYVKVKKGDSAIKNFIEALEVKDGHGQPLLSSEHRGLVLMQIGKEYQYLAEETSDPEPKRKYNTESAQHLQKALALTDSAGEFIRKGKIRGNTFVQLSFAQYDLGDFQGALNSLKQAFELLDPKENDPSSAENYATLLAQYGYTLSALSNSEQGADYVTQALNFKDSNGDFALKGDERETAENFFKPQASTSSKVEEESDLDSE